MKKTKGLVSTFLALVMVLGMLPGGSAFAAAADGPAAAKAAASHVTALSLQARALPSEAAEPAAPAEEAAAEKSCGCSDCTCADCQCTGGVCTCGGCGETAAPAEETAPAKEAGIKAASHVTALKMQTAAPAAEASAEPLAWPVQPDTGEHYRPSREKKTDEAYAVLMDERDEDTYCPGCKRNHDDCSWYCDECNWCDECISNGDCGINHCGECQKCEADHYCSFCTDDEGYGGDWLVCFDCARDSSRHCSLCEDTHLVFGYFCESCEACGNCIADGTSEAQHCAVCHACDPEWCHACTEERTDSSGSYCLCMSCCEDLEMHCVDCGGCYTSGDVEICWGSDWNICIDCCTDEGNHCDECDAHVVDWCWATGDGNRHCKYCMLENSGFMECIICGDVWCEWCGEGAEFDRGDYVGICESCIDNRNLWCPYCETVDEGLEWCPDGGEHCIDCCEQWLCDNCGRCTEALGIDVCPDCGLCVDCCLENAEAEGCSCGDYCVEGSDWNEHFCSECGACFDDVDQCEECMLCVDCCADNSECSDGMCVQDSEYGEHFCVDCGECFHDVDPCDDCVTAGDYLCVECCAERTGSNSNCEHGVCMNSWEWAEHYCDTHDCCYEDCSDDPTIHDHAWGADGNCTICGKNKDGKPVIVQQPEDKTMTAPYYKDLLENPAPQVSFHVRAKGDSLSYQWYNASTGQPLSGEGYYNADTATLTVDVGYNACSSSDYSFFCRVYSGTKYTDSAVAKVDAKHNYRIWAPYQDGSTYTVYKYNDDGSIKETITLRASTVHRRYCGAWALDDCYEYDRVEPHRFGGWQVVQEPTSEHGGLLERKCVDCGGSDYKELPKLTPHEHSWVTGQDATNQYMHSQVCSVCGLKSQTEPHTFGDWTETKRATEESTGTRERTCTVCGYKETEVTPKLAHKHLQQYKAGKIVCEEGETWEYVWGVTGTRADDDYHFKKCIVQIDDGAGGKTECGEVDRATRMPHDYMAWAYNESAKTFSRSCADCGYVQTVTYTDDGKYIPLSSTTADFYDAMGNKIYIAKAGQLITARPNSDAYENLFQYWTTTGLDITSEQQSSIPLVFRMPAYPVTVGIQRGLCVEPSVSQAEGIKHLHYRLYEGEWGHMGTEDSSTYIDPTCTAEGREALLICRVCGAYINGIGGEVIEPLGHSYELDESTVRAATCTDYGYTGDSVCKRCGDRIKGQRTAKLGHSYAAEATRIREADCTHAALYGYVCQNEGCEKYQRAESPEPALGHDWGEWEWVKLPTATEDGEMECFCSRCKNGKSKTIPRGTNTGIVEEVITDLGTISVHVPTAGDHIYNGDDINSYILRKNYPAPTLPAGSHYKQNLAFDSAWQNIDDEHIEDITYQAEVDYGSRFVLSPNVLYKFPASASEISVKVVDQNGNEFLRDAPLEKGGVFKVTVSGGNVYIKLNYMPPHTYKDPYYYLDYDYSDPAQFTVSGARAIFECTSGGANYETAAECVTTPDPEGCLTFSLTAIGPDGKTWTHTQTTEHLVNDAAAVAATCTEGVHEAGYRCSLCGKYFTGYDGITELASGVGVIPALGHSWGDWVETTPGVEETRYCTRCDATETRSLTVQYRRITGSAAFWNDTNDAVFMLYEDTTSDEDIRASWQDDSYASLTGAVAVSSPIYTAAEETVDGKDMYTQAFSLEDVPDGDYKLAIFKPGKYVPMIVSISVSGADADAGTVKLWLYGDVNYDGAVKANDATIISRYVNALSSVFGTEDAATEANRQLAADVNGDGNVKANDATLIKRYVNALSSPFDSMK